MSGGTKVLGLHLAGVLSLAAWIGLAIASHLIRRPLALLLGTLAWEWLIYLAAWRIASSGEPRQALRVIVAWATTFLVCGLFSAPILEDDYFRLLWDGRQFATTGNPYASPPAACFGVTGLPDRFQEILDNISYPDVPTIYGPVCQLGFLLSYWAAPGQLWPWKTLLFAAQIILVLIWVAIARRRDEHFHRPGNSRFQPDIKAALLIGWCPLLIFETGFNGHPDILGITFLSAALLLRMRQQNLACGLLCGLAAGSKVFALLLAPFLLQRSRKAWLGFGAALFSAYAPFWLQGSAADVVGLMTFAREWEFNSSIYGIARSSFGAPIAKLITSSVFFAAWLFLFRRLSTGEASRASGPASLPGAEVYGMLFLLSATVNPWYLLWLAPFVALRPSTTGVAAMALVSLSYLTGLNLGAANVANFEHPDWVRPIEYGGIALAAIADWWRWRAGLTATPQPFMSAVF